MNTKLLTLTLISLLAFSTGCNLKSNNNSEGETGLRNKVIVLSSSSNWKGAGHLYERISGEFQNNTGRELKAVELQGTFYDNSNKVLSTGITVQKDIAANEIRSFEVVMDYSELKASYKVVVTKVYK